MRNLLLFITPFILIVQGCLEPTPSEILENNGYAINNLELTRAVSSDNSRMVELLFQTEVNTTSQGGALILPFVVAHKNTTILEIFLKNGANPDIYRRDSLRTAIENRDEEAIRLLMRHGADANRKNSSGANAVGMVIKTDDTLLKILIEEGADYEPFLTKAVAHGNLNLIKKLQKYGADINIKNGSALSKAIEINDFYVSDFLIRNGAKVTQRNALKTNHLMQAIDTRNAKLAELLITHGADINFRYSQPLKHAIEQGETAIVKTLLHHGAKTDITIHGNSLVKYAMKNHLFDIAKLLIDFKVDTNIEINGSPLVLYALWDQKRCIAKSAILAGTDINAKDQLTNESILKFALKQKDPALVKLLIYNGADYRQAFGDALYNRDEQSIKTLLASGADMNKVYDDGLTTLTEAIEKGDKDSIELLIKYGVDTNVETKTGTPLSYLLATDLSSYRKAAIAKILINNGADTNQKNIKGQTLIAIAAYKGDLTTLSILLTYGADLNQKDNNGWTPLMYAQNQNNLSIVKTLLFKGAKLDTTDKINDWTALMYAVKDNQSEIVETLIANGADVEYASSVNDLTAKDIAEKYQRDEILEILEEE